MDEFIRFLVVSSHSTCIRCEMACCSVLFCTTEIIKLNKAQYFALNTYQENVVYFMLFFLILSPLSRGKLP